MKVLLLYVRRFWSLGLAFCTAGLSIYLGFGTDLIEDDRNQMPTVWKYGIFGIVCTLLCLALVVHSWLKQKQIANRWWQQCFWALVLVLPLLVCVVRGLGNVQVSTYDLSIEHDQCMYLHYYTGLIKDRLIWLVPIDMLLILVWGLAMVGMRGPKSAGRPHP